MMATCRSRELSMHHLAFLEEQAFWVMKGRQEGVNWLLLSESTTHCNPILAEGHRLPMALTSMHLWGSHLHRPLPGRLTT